MEMPPKILHENTRNKNTKQKRKLLPPKTENPARDFLIKLEETQTILKANKNKKKNCCTENMFPSPTQVQHKSLR
jgi:hypothetical protein